MNDEIIRQVDIGNYIVYSDGRIWSKKSKRFLTSSKNKVGYYIVSIHSRRSTTLHRLIAKLFIENPLNLPQVNHKDFDKLNNNWWNLEWCTNQQNQDHRWKQKKDLSETERSKILEVRKNSLDYTESRKSS